MNLEYLEKMKVKILKENSNQLNIKYYGSKRKN